MQLDENMPITLNLNLGKTNAILASLSKQPFEMVAGIITDIQQQAGPQVMEYQAKNAPPGGPDAPAAPPAPPAV